MHAKVYSNYKTMQMTSISESCF